MVYATKVLARKIQHAALVGRLGTGGERNSTGDAQKKLDLFANQVVLDTLPKRAWSRRSYLKNWRSPGPLFAPKDPLSEARPLL
jgi:hypothetical protein